MTFQSAYHNIFLVKLRSNILMLKKISVVKPNANKLNASVEKNAATNKVISARYKSMTLLKAVYSIKYMQSKYHKAS